MGSTRWLALLVTAACGPAVATAPAPEPEPPPEEPAPRSEAGPILWRVDGPAGPSYLLGTVHLGITARDLDPVILDVLGTCDTFISEADLTRVDRSLVFNISTLPESQSLRQLIGDEAFAELERLLRVPQLDRFQPWFAYVNVLQRLFPGGASIDEQLLETARDAEMKLVFLEDVNDQLQVLSRVIDAADLKLILDPSSGERESVTALIEAYRRGDFATIEKLIAAPEVIAEDPEEFAAMFTERNRAWLPGLSEQLGRGRVFVAVGAGHFAGPTGLLKLLADKGFEAHRVPASAKK